MGKISIFWKHTLWFRRYSFIIYPIGQVHEKETKYIIYRVIQSLKARQYFRKYQKYYEQILITFIIVRITIKVPITHSAMYNIIRNINRYAICTDYISHLVK